MQNRWARGSRNFARDGNGTGRGTAPFGLSTDELRKQRLLRFDNVCALAKAVPSYRLHLSLTGPFWEEIERVLEGDRAP